MYTAQRSTKRVHTHIYAGIRQGIAVCPSRVPEKSRHKTKMVFPLKRLNCMPVKQPKEVKMEKGRKLRSCVNW
jgi:hypothetical protein